MSIVIGETVCLMKMSSITNDSIDETEENTSGVLLENNIPDETTRIEDMEKKIKPHEDLDEIEQSQIEQSSSSKCKMKGNENPNISTDSHEIFKVQTNSNESCKDEQNTEQCTQQPESNIESDQPPETVECLSNKKKRKLEADEDFDVKVPAINIESDATSSDTPSNLCSVRSNRSQVKSDDAKPVDHTTVVAEHYNALEEKGLSFRSQSRIFYMRNFNNWIKSMLINEYTRKIRQFSSHGSPLRVMDICCGKGGDLFKWRNANVSHLICADIAEMSVRQCENRYKDVVNQAKNDRAFTPIFTAEFITADCTKVRLREKYKDPSLQFDIVSCQFALHYSFESLPQAMCMLQNVSECLKPGGYFIATLPDANNLVHLWKKADGNKFGNAIYNIEFCCDKDNIPLFGAEYNFHLEGVVNCPEFLVYLPLLKKLALKWGLEFVSFESFDEFYERHQQEGKLLLKKMQALETYPPYHETPLLGQNQHDYQHARQYMQNSTGHRKIGTLSLSEWEASSLYGVIAFQKMKTSWNSEGKAEYSKFRD